MNEDYENLVDVETEDIELIEIDNYEELKNKPKINDIELTGNKTLEELGIIEAIKDNIKGKADSESIYTKEETNTLIETAKAEIEAQMEEKIGNINTVLSSLTSPAGGEE